MAVGAPASEEITSLGSDMNNQHLLAWDLTVMANPGSVDAQAPATQGLVVQVFQMLSDKLETSHKSLRTSIDSVADGLGARMTAHDREDRLVADRVLILETNRTRDLQELIDEKARMKSEMDRRMFAISSIIAVIGMLISHFWK